MLGVCVMYLMLLRHALKLLFFSYSMCFCCTISNILILLVFGMEGNLSRLQRGPLHSLDVISEATEK